MEQIQIYYTRLVSKNIYLSTTYKNSKTLEDVRFFATFIKRIVKYPHDDAGVKRNLSEKHHFNAMQMLGM